jgi:hypothetical protein
MPHAEEESKGVEMPANPDYVLPVLRVLDIPSDEIAECRLVERLSCTNSVGAITGTPKCAKT